MTPYHAKHADLFRAVADILVRDYIAPSETAETVADWLSTRAPVFLLVEPSELAALIAVVEGYENKEARK